MLIFNIRAAIRNLLQFKSHTLINLIGLNIALACVIVVAAWTLQEQQYDRFHNQSKSLYMITTDIIFNNEVVNTYQETSALLASRLRDEIPGIGKICHFANISGGRNLKTDDPALKETGIDVDKVLINAKLADNFNKSR